MRYPGAWARLKGFSTFERQAELTVPNKGLGCMVRVLLFLSVVTLCGLLGVYMVVSDTGTTDISLSELNESMDGKLISTQGVLTEVSE